MPVFVITPPAGIVALAQAKAHLNVDVDDDDALIQAYVDAATGHIDGPDGWLNRALGVQTLEARFDAFPYSSPCDYLKLPFPPLIDVLSVKYDDVAGAEQTLDPALYETDPQGLRPVIGQLFPATYLRRGAVRVTFRAGYPVDLQAEPVVNTLPPAITSAILLMVGDLYANRETTAAGVVSAIPMSTTAERLLAPFRVWQI